MANDSKTPKRIEIKELTPEQQILQDSLAQVKKLQQEIKLGIRPLERRPERTIFFPYRSDKKDYDFKIYTDIQGKTRFEDMKKEISGYSRRQLNTNNEVAFANSIINSLQYRFSASTSNPYFAIPWEKASTAYRWVRENIAEAKKERADKIRPLEERPYNTILFPYDIHSPYADERYDLKIYTRQGKTYIEDITRDRQPKISSTLLDTANVWKFKESLSQVLTDAFWKNRPVADKKAEEAYKIITSKHLSK